MLLAVLITFLFACCRSFKMNYVEPEQTHTNFFLSRSFSLTRLNTPHNTHCTRYAYTPNEKQKCAPGVHRPFIKHFKKQCQNSTTTKLGILRYDTPQTEHVVLRVITHYTFYFVIRLCAPIATGTMPERSKAFFLSRSG